MSGEEHHRHEDRADDDGGRDYSKGNLPCTRYRGDQRRFAFLYPVIDIFQHDNRVIDHQPNGQHQRKQSQQVDRKAEKPQNRKCCEQADRHGDGRDQSCAPTAQKQENHQHHQRRCFRQRHPDRIDGAADEQRVVRPDGDRHALRQGGLDLFGQLFRSLRNRQRVRPRLAHNPHTQR